MARDLGRKYTCFKCGSKFYDLHRADPLCPKCGADQRLAPKPQPISAAARKAKEKEEAADEVDELETPLLATDDDDEAAEDDIEAVEAEEP
jgi:uncharacterized protein (TIGR02300 family)